MQKLLQWMWNFELYPSQGHVPPNDPAHALDWIYDGGTGLHAICSKADGQHQKFGIEARHLRLLSKMVWGLGC